MATAATDAYATIVKQLDCVFSIVSVQRQSQEGPRAILLLIHVYKEEGRELQEGC
jgi:hypothetical protein